MPIVWHAILVALGVAPARTHNMHYSGTLPCATWPGTAAQLRLCAVWQIGYCGVCVLTTVVEQHPLHHQHLSVRFAQSAVAYLRRQRQQPEAPRRCAGPSAVRMLP